MLGRDTELELAGSGLLEGWFKLEQDPDREGVAAYTSATGGDARASNASPGLTALATTSVRVWGTRSVGLWKFRRRIKVILTRKRRRG